MKIIYKQQPATKYSDLRYGDYFLDKFGKLALYQKMASGHESNIREIRINALSLVSTMDWKNVHFDNGVYKCSGFSVCSEKGLTPILEEPKELKISDVKLDEYFHYRGDVCLKHSIDSYRRIVEVETGSLYCFGQTFDYTEDFVIDGIVSKFEFETESE